MEHRGGPVLGDWRQDARQGQLGQDTESLQEKVPESQWRATQGQVQEFGEESGRVAAAREAGRDTNQGQGEQEQDHRRGLKNGRSGDEEKKQKKK